MNLAVFHEPIRRERCRQISDVIDTEENGDADEATGAEAKNKSRPSIVEGLAPDIDIDRHPVTSASDKDNIYICLTTTQLSALLTNLK